MPITAMTLSFSSGGPLETGLWCDSCALPSAIRQTFLIESEPPSRHYPQIVTLTVCADCGPRTEGDR